MSIDLDNPPPEARPYLELYEREKREAQELRQSLAYIKAERDELRLQLTNSNDIRGALHGAAVDTAKSMVRALNLIEAAFYRGIELGKAGITNYTSVDAAFREFAKEIMK